MTQNGPVRVVRRIPRTVLTEEQAAALAMSRRTYKLAGRKSARIPEQKIFNFRGDDGLFRYATTKQRRAVYVRDAGQCQYCGADVRYADCMIDHIVPWPEGRTLLDNLVVSCPPCNRLKGNQHIPSGLAPR